MRLKVRATLCLAFRAELKDFFVFDGAEKPSSRRIVPERVFRLSVIRYTHLASSVV